MEVSVIVLVIAFVILLALNVPIAICIGVATILTMLFTIAPGPAITTVAQQMAAGINSFTLLAIPFFVLSGLLMGRGGIARRLIDFAKVIVGMFPGGLAYVNTMACMFFWVRARTCMRPMRMAVRWTGATGAADGAAGRSSFTRTARTWWTGMISVT